MRLVAQLVGQPAVAHIDNIGRLPGNDLERVLKPGARLKVAAWCVSMQAFEALKAALEQVDEFHFIFTSPTLMAKEVTDKIRKERKQLHIPRSNASAKIPAPAGAWQGCPMPPSFC